jgi:hypothetical protein
VPSSSAVATRMTSATGVPTTRALGRFAAAIRSLAIVAAAKHMESAVAFRSGRTLHKCPPAGSSVGTLFETAALLDGRWRAPGLLLSSITHAGPAGVGLSRATIRLSRTAVEA